MPPSSSSGRIEAGAYATGILAMMVSGPVAVTVSAVRARQRVWAAGFDVLTGILIYALTMNIIAEPSCILISSVFIGGIIAVSVISRVSRSTEIRVERINFDDVARKFISDSVAFDGRLNIVANKRETGKSPEYAEKETAQRMQNAVPGGADVVFLEVEIVDPSAFSGVLDVRGVTIDGYRVLRVNAAAIPNTIAAILLALRDSTGVLPHTYFEWSEGHPIAHLMRYVLLGRGDTGPIVHEILREHDADPAVRPIVHVA